MPKDIKEKKEEKVDIGSLNIMLDIGRKLMKIFYVATIIAIILLGINLLKTLKIFGIIKEILIIISPIFIGIVIAWLFDPMVRKLQAKGVPRFAGCIIAYVLLIGIIIGFLYLLLPNLIYQIRDFVGTVPALLEDLQGIGDKFFGLFDKTGVDVAVVKEKIYGSVAGFLNGLTTNLPNTIVQIVRSIISGGVSFVLGLMIGFYLLFDFDKFNKTILRHIPKKWIPSYKELTYRINTSLRSYVQGIFVIMFLVFITQSLGLTLAGLTAPLLFAMFCAVTDIIPYFGPYIGGIPAVLVGFTISPMTGIYTLISILIVQLLENNFYQPIIMSHAVKLHPVVIILSLLIFQHFFGILGMVLATPVVACLKVILTFVNEKIHLMDKLFKSENIEVES